MAELETVIRYDGPALAGHEMDVADLAPALLALASLIQEANHKFNGDRSAVRVVVNADLEQKCFQLKIKFLQDILQTAKSFLDGDMATLKDICEWIGIVGGTGFSLFKLLVHLGQKQQDSVVFQADGSDDSTIVQAQTIENLNLHIHLPEGTPQQVRDLLADESIVAKAQGVLRPATKRDYDSVGFYEPSGREVFKASKEEAAAVLALPMPTFDPGVAEADPEADETPVPFKTRVFVKAQRNEGVGQWELKWGGRAKLVTMDDLPWLERFQSGQVPHSLPLYLDVEMEMITSNTDPDAPERYRVIQVLGVVPSAEGKQTEMFDDKPA